MQGNIGVTTENIFPIIKKFLYSDHDIFIREIISNAVDATQKAKTLITTGEYPAEGNPEFSIKVTLDKINKTITVSDNGIGMTNDEVCKYIAEIALSGATEFLEKYKDKTNIIGHFGLGFYSSFMVSDSVEIITKSYKENAVAQHWSCDGSTTYEIEDIDKDSIGTDVIMHIGTDFEEYLETPKMYELISRYCKFMPYDIVLVSIEPSNDPSNNEPKTNTLNIDRIEPIWTKKPSELKDEDYKTFYQKLYPGKGEPLFWIHLNVDFPFTLKGILYFPEIAANPVLEKNKINLYCNQVYVTDNVTDILPEFLSLLHGIIDSPDIPLNVSRSYLQSDSNVKKISGHIINKVISSLKTIFTTDREDYEKKWSSIETFIQIGLITEKDIYNKIKELFLIKDTNNKYYNIEEYINLVKDKQTDKDEKVILLYTFNTNKQYTYIKQAEEYGYNVLVMESQFTPYILNALEENNKDVKFVRVDANTIDKVIDKGITNESTMNKEDRALLIDLFSSQLKNDFQGIQLSIRLADLDENALPISLTADEYSRRIKEAAAQNPNLIMYMNNKTQVYVTLNTNAKIIKAVVEKAKAKIGEKYNEFVAIVKDDRDKIELINQTNKDKNPKDISTTDKDAIDTYNKHIMDTNLELSNLVQKYTNKNNKVKQLLDIAYLQNNMLEGEAFAEFIKRSIKVLE